MNRRFVVRLGVGTRALGMLISGFGLLALVVVTVAAMLGVKRFPSLFGQGAADYATCAWQLAMLAAAGGGVAAVGRRIVWKHASRTSGADPHTALVKLLDVTVDSRHGGGDLSPIRSGSKPARPTSRAGTGRRGVGVGEIRRGDEHQRDQDQRSEADQQLH